MPTSQSQIKSTAMKNFLKTYGGMVAAGEQPDDALIEIFEEFDSPETMFAWIAERWVAGGFDKVESGGKAKTAKKDPNKPTKWCNAYMHFTMERRAEVKEHNPEMSNTEITKELGRIWREDLSEEEKAPYQAASDEQKAAYDEAMANYTPPHSDGEAESPKKGKKKQRAAGAPKKALNAYMHFTMDQRETVKTEHPDMSNTEVTKELGRLWREEMDEDQKAPFVNAAAEDKRRYAREMESYNPAEAASQATKTPTKKSPAKKSPEPKKAPPKKAAPKKPAAPKKDATPKKDTTPKKAAPKKAAAPKKTKKQAQMDDAYASFVEVESEAITQEREDGEEEPFTAAEMEEYLNDLWADLSAEDRLAYLEAE